MIDHYWYRLHGCFSFQDFYLFVANLAGPTWQGVEVGALYGQSAAFLAVELANRGVGASLSVVELSDSHQVLAEALHPVQHVIGRIHSPMSSVDASRLYDDGSLDMVFLDGDHSLAGVRSDLDAWTRKVRPGGLIAGHDFAHYFHGVMRAVLERFPSVRLFRGSEWPGDDGAHGSQRAEAEADFRARSAHGGPSDYLATWWVEI